MVYADAPSSTNPIVNPKRVKSAGAVIYLMVDKISSLPSFYCKAPHIGKIKWAELEYAEEPDGKEGCKPAGKGVKKVYFF